MLIRAETDRAVDEVTETLKRKLEVKSVSRNYLIFPSAVTPNDTDFSDQWYLSDGDDVDLDAPDAWSIEKGDDDIVVAIIDNGIDLEHEDLDGQFWTNTDETDGDNDDDDSNGYNDDIVGWDFIDDDNDPSGDCSNSHATAIAGIIGAKTNNNQGVAGINWNIQLMVLKAFDPDSNCGGDVIPVVDAIDYAIDNGADIINASFEFTANIPAIEDAFDDAETADIIVAAPAGNSGVDMDGGALRKPCGYTFSNIVCVAAVDDDGDLAGFSNSGVESVDVGAPGVDIYSTLEGDDYGEPSPVGGLGDNSGNGTSFAAPQAAGVAALIMAENPSYDFEEVIENLLVSAQPTSTGDLAGEIHTGCMLNARAAIRAFSDSFDDSDDGDEVFSDSPLRTRWSVVKSGTGSLCENEVDTISGTKDRVIEAELDGTTSYTVAGWESTYDPGGAVQTILVRVSNPGGTDFENETGRIGVGLVGDSSHSSKTCSASGKSYTEMTIGGSVIAGLNLSDRKPFIFFDSPYTETTYSAISTNDLDGVTKLSIAIGLGSSSVFLSITNSDTGEQIFLEEGISYPSPWTFNGTDKGAFIFYGTGSDSGTHKILVHDFLSVR